ncbi:hypothetical protein WA026_011002 [Henosepilachna vigintioctopunctata]|uniref:Uncharacterized protein n=1 Tax=Henosepilachna vigintioctopunctata TaxID=420089 RepID=A0AAW1V0Y2_9CUCU
MGYDRHQMLTCKEHKRPNGSAIIASHLQIPLYPKIEELPQNKTCILRSSNSQDFRGARLGLKQKLIRNCPNFLLTENSVLEFRETYPLEHSIFSCATGFLYTDNYFNDKRIFECNRTKNVKNYLWISNQALNANYPKIQYKNDSVNATPKKKAEKCQAYPKVNKKFEKSQDVRANRTNENEVKRNKDISTNKNYFGNVTQKTPNNDTKRHGKMNEEVNNAPTKSDTKLLQNSFLSNKCCLSENNDSKEVKINKNYVSIADEYESLSKISSASMDKCSADLKIHSDGKQNVQVFCLNCNNEPEFSMPTFLERCCSDNYLSAEEPSIGSSCECVTCPKAEESIIQLTNQGVQTVNTNIRKELRNMQITTNDKGYFIDRPKCNLENPSTRAQCPGVVKTSCAECATPPLHTTGQCQNSMRKSTIQNDDMESFSTLSLFFIMKDLNTGNGSYCKRQESYRLLSTAMICMRVNNTQPKKKPRKPNIACANERTKPCSDTPIEHTNHGLMISRPDCRKNRTFTDTHQNSQFPYVICPSKRVGSDRKMNSVFTETLQENGCKVLGVQTSEHKEKRYPRELNLLLSFHPDKRRNLEVKGCPGERARSLPYRTYLQRQLPKADKTAQACIAQQSACVQLSMTNTPTMHEKGNQFCPARKSKSIQPSSTIFLRPNRPATFPRESSDRRSRICRSNFSTESSLFYSPPPCALYLPDFGEASGQTLEAPPATPFMIPMEVDFRDETSSTSLACNEMKKKYSSTSQQVRSCTANSKPKCKFGFGEEKLKNVAKIEEINPSKNNYLDLGSTRTIQPPCLTCSSHTNKDSHTPLENIGFTDSDEGLEILKLKQTSLLSKKHELFAPFKFKSANDIECCDKRKEDIQLFREDFQSLKKAIEKFMTIDATDKQR